MSLIEFEQIPSLPEIATLPSVARNDNLIIRHGIIPSTERGTGACSEPGEKVRFEYITNLPEIASFLSQ
jgi:hypothetical protein